MHIAVIEDNSGLAQAVSDVLKDHGHAVDVIHNGYDADEYLKAEAVNLVILDLGLPGVSGMEILRRMRGRGDSTPVIVLTAQSRTDDAVLGLNAGADDFIGKPFDTAELIARINAMLRRSIKFSEVEKVGNIDYARESRSLSVDGTPLDIPRKELTVFECLVSSKGRLVSKEALLTYVYGSGADKSGAAIEVYVSRLRRRLGPHGVTIKAARGIGYRLEC